MREIKIGDRVNVIKEPTKWVAEECLGRTKNLLVKRIEETGGWYHLTTKSSKEVVCTYRNYIELSHKINKIRRIE